MRREERVTVQGPVKEQQPDGMSHRGGGGGQVLTPGDRKIYAGGGEGIATVLIFSMLPQQAYGGMFNVRGASKCLWTQRSKANNSALGSWAAWDSIAAQCALVG